MSFGPTVFDCDAVALDIAEFRKPFAEGSYKWPIILARSLVKEANRGSCRLLRARRERPRRRAADERDEIAPLHSITSSARASRLGGTSRPSAFAVLRLITSSNRLGRSIGRSAGLAPRRMRSA